MTEIAIWTCEIPTEYEVQSLKLTGALLPGVRLEIVRDVRSVRAYLKSGPVPDAWQFDIQWVENDAPLPTP